MHASVSFSGTSTSAYIRTINLVFFSPQYSKLQRFVPVMLYIYFVGIDIKTNAAEKQSQD